MALYVAHKISEGNTVNLAVVNYFVDSTDDCIDFCRRIALSDCGAVAGRIEPDFTIVPVQELYARAVLFPIPGVKGIFLTVPVANDFIPFANSIRVNPLRAVRF